MNSKSLRGILCLLAAAALLTGCGSKPPLPGGGLSFCASSELRTPSPWIEDLNQTSASSAANMFDRLIEQDPASPHSFLPSLAQSWEVSGDGLEYTFSKGDILLLGGKNLVKNLQMNKVSIIAREIGVQPVLAFGNAFSDASMVNYTIIGNKYKALGFMLLCDDTTREYGNPAKADKLLKACEPNGWIPVSMRDDFATIYGENVIRTAKP